MRRVDGGKGGAGRHSCCTATTELAWLLAKGEMIVPMPGSKRRAALEDSKAAVDITLSAADIDALEAAAPVGGTAGLRYGERMMSMVRL